TNHSEVTMISNLFYSSLHCWSYIKQRSFTSELEVSSKVIVIDSKYCCNNLLSNNKYTDIFSCLNVLTTLRNIICCYCCFQYLFSFIFIIYPLFISTVMAICVFYIKYIVILYFLLFILCFFKYSSIY